MGTTSMLYKVNATIYHFREIYDHKYEENADFKTIKPHEPISFSSKSDSCFGQMVENWTQLGKLSDIHIKKSLGRLPKRPSKTLNVSHINYT